MMFMGAPLNLWIEYFNPGGSVKDRVGLEILTNAEKTGLQKPGYTIIEATAGNTGIDFAMAAFEKGYQLLLVMPAKFSIENDEDKKLAALIFSTKLKSNGKVIITDTMYCSDEVKNVLLEDILDKNYTSLAEDLQTEFYTTHQVLSEIFKTIIFQSFSGCKGLLLSYS